MVCGKHVFTIKCPYSINLLCNIWKIILKTGVCGTFWIYSLGDSRDYWNFQNFLAKPMMKLKHWQNSMCVFKMWRSGNLYNKSEGAFLPGFETILEYNLKKLNDLFSLKL